MPKKSDPLNKKRYPAVSATVVVSDLKAAVSFYQKAFGFKKRFLAKGPDGKAMHAELALRGSVLMLGPESAQWGTRTPKTVGGASGSLYLYVDNVDKVVAKALQLGATANGPVMDMFWGDRCGNIADPDGNAWNVATHQADRTPREMKKLMLAQFGG